MSPLPALPPHPAATLPDLLRAELAARGLITESLAAVASINPRTLRDHLAGKYPISADEARALLCGFRGLGPFLIPQVEDELVIRGGTNRSDRPSTGVSAALRRVRVDTVWVVLNPHPNERAALKEAVEATFKRSGTKAGGVKWPFKTDDGVLARPKWEPGADREWSTVTLQLSPWRDPHRRILQQLRRTMLRAQPAPVRFNPDLRLSRIDVACDYGVEPYWLLVNRPKVRTFKHLEEEDGGITWYFGARETGSAMLRVYDGEARHPEDPPPGEGPWTRIEVEFRPKQKVGIGDVASMMRTMSPFQHLDLALRVAPGLSLLDVALVELARAKGLPYVRGRLGRKERVHLSEAWDRLSKTEARIETLGVLDGRPSAPGQALSTGWWECAAELARQQLLFDPDADLRGEDLWWDDPELLYAPAT